jgi:outer membrane protein insertion porin family
MVAISVLYIMMMVIYFSACKSCRNLLVENDSIDLEIRINEGPQATIKNVIIEGNDKTNEHVIRRELRTFPGDKFSRSDLIRSQREIAQSRFLRSTGNTCRANSKSG